MQNKVIYTQEEAETLGAVDETALSLEDAIAASDETSDTEIETDKEIKHG